MIVLQILSAVCLLAGALFILVSAVGVLRFPDFYTRLHAGGVTDTLGQMLVLLGLVLSAGLTLVSFKLGLIAFFVLILNPTATHALARGAWVCGVRPFRAGDEPFRQREGQMTDGDREEIIEQTSAEGTKQTEADPDGEAS